MKSFTLVAGFAGFNLAFGFGLLAGNPIAATFVDAGLAGLLGAALMLAGWQPLRAGLTRLETARARRQVSGSTNAKTQPA